MGARRFCFLELGEIVCAERGTAIDPKYFVGYGLTDTMNRFTNPALLVSDQNPEKVNVNRFTGEGGRLEESRKFEGFILRQRTDALSYLRELNRPVMQKTREQRGRRVTGCVRVPENHPAFL